MGQVLIAGALFFIAGAMFTLLMQWIYRTINGEPRTVPFPHLMQKPTVLETPVPGIRRVLPVSEVLQQVKKTGYEGYFREMETGSTYFRARVLPHMLPVLLNTLRRDDRFKEGILFGLHRDVGNALTDFRSHTNQFGDGSLQFVIDQKTGACYGDCDRFSPYSDVVGFVGHSGEVLGGFWRNIKDKFRIKVP